MNSDAIDALITKLIVAALAAGGGDAIASQSQVQAIVYGAGALLAVGYGFYKHYGMRKVPEKAIVTSIAPTVADAKAASAPTVAAAAK
jgi:hypothetical protein